MKTILLISIAMLLAGLAQAQPPDPFATDINAPLGNGVTRFGTPTQPPLPADFFGPGSDPFEGQIGLEGSPFDTPAWGDAVLLVLRHADPVPPFAPVGATGIVDVELLALNLVSIEPMVVEYFGGAYTEVWDLRVSLSGLAPPPGFLDAFKTHENGGTYDAVLPIQPVYTFERVGDGQTVVWDTGLEGLAPLQGNMSFCPWVHGADPLLGLVAPSDGIFVAGVEETLPGDVHSQCPREVFVWDPDGSLEFGVVPAEFMPEVDPFETEPCDGMGGGTEHFFGFGNSPPIPADFFEPGSDPFTGAVCLEGEPLGPTAWGEWDAADTLILRPHDPFDRCELPSPEPRVVPIEIVELSLRSIEPIVVTYFGMSPELWDVYVDLSEVPAPRGDAYVLKTHDNGGTFDAVLPVHPRYTFVRQYDLAMRVLDTGLEMMPHLQYEFLGCDWVHETGPFVAIHAPSNGAFVPGVEETVPGDPATQLLRLLPGVEASGAGTHVLRPALSDGVAVEGLPAVYAELRAHPNPFNPSTKIGFELERGGPVGLRVYDLQGVLVRTLFDGELPPGAHHRTWRAVDDRGRRVASGVYLAVLEAGCVVRATKMAVLK